MSGPKGKVPHADTDARRRPDPERPNVPEGLRREPKPPYDPRSGRGAESTEPTKNRHARDRHVAEEKK